MTDISTTKDDSPAAVIVHTRMRPVVRALVILGAVLTSLLALQLFNLQHKLDEYETKDLTRDLSSFVVGNVYRTVGGCDAESSPVTTYYDAMRDEEVTRPMGDMRTVFCPYLPNVNEPNPDTETRVYVHQNLYADCVGKFRDPGAFEHDKVFLGVTCTRQ